MPSAERYAKLTKEQRDKQREYGREWLKKNYKPKGRKPRELRHGTTTGYRYGCRCELCTEAIAVYQRVARGGTAPKNPGKYNVTRSTNGGNKHD